MNVEAVVVWFQAGMSFDKLPPGLWTVWQNTHEWVAMVTEFKPVMLRSWAVPSTPVAGGAAERRTGANAKVRARRMVHMVVSRVLVVGFPGDFGNSTGQKMQYLSK